MWIEAQSNHALSYSPVTEICEINRTELRLLNMRRGRPKQVLRLSEEEHQQLRSLAQRARSLPAVARRARVVLAGGEGLDKQSSGQKAALLTHNGWQMAGPVPQGAAGGTL